MLSWRYIRTEKNDKDNVHRLKNAAFGKEGDSCPDSCGDIIHAILTLSNSREFMSTIGQK